MGAIASGGGGGGGGRGRLEILLSLKSPPPIGGVEVSGTDCIGTDVFVGNERRFCGKPLEKELLLSLSPPPSAAGALLRMPPPSANGLEEVAGDDSGTSSANELNEEKDDVDDRGCKEGSKGNVDAGA